MREKRRSLEVEYDPDLDEEEEEDYPEYTPIYDPEEDDYELIEEDEDREVRIFDPDPGRRRRRYYPRRRVRYDPRRKGRRRRYLPRRIRRYGPRLRKWYGRRKATIMGAINKLIFPVGLILAFLSDPTSGERGLSGSWAFITARIKAWKFPKLESIFWYLTNHPPYKNPLILGIAGVIAGYVLPYIPFRGLKSVSVLLRRLGFGLIAGTILAAFLFLPAINPRSSSNPGGRSSYEY